MGWRDEKRTATVLGVSREQVQVRYLEDEGRFHATDPALPYLAAGGGTEAAARTHLELLRHAIESRPGLPFELAVAAAIIERVMNPVRDLADSPPPGHF
jgi:hypothetical protein